MKRRTRDAGDFHEAPLVIFTWLAILGGGMAAGRIPLGILGLVAWTPGRMEGGFVALSIGAGMIASLLHLGRRGRMLQALRQSGRSALSTEVAFAGLTAAAAFEFFILPTAGSYVTLASVLWGVTAVCGLGLLFSIARVYMLPGQLSWGTAAAPSPVILGVAFGILPYAKPGALTTITVTALLAAEGLLYALRWWFLEHRRNWGAPAHARCFKARWVLVLTRLVWASILPITAALLEAYTAALAMLGIGIAIDRFAFYALALRQTTEAEVTRIETLTKAVRT